MIMAEVTVNFDEKSCGACVHWEGPRTVCGNEVTYNGLSNGKCNSPDSPAYGREVKVVFYCFAKKDLYRTCDKP
jgi:hypothetical protein